MSNVVTGRLDVLVVSRIVLDDLHERDGRVIEGVLGGSGFWAAFGAALVADEVAVTCKVGPDFVPYRARLRELGIRTDGLVDVGRPTSRTVVTYPQGEERHEEPLPDWDAHVAMRTVPDEFPDSVADPRGYYVFRGWHPGFWEQMRAVVERSGTPLLWEIPASVCTPQDRESVANVLRSVSTLSLNLEEATSLCGPHDETALIERLHDMGARRVALRLGARGAIYSDGERLFSARPPRGVPVVDVTGAGNSFSGALLAAELARPGDHASNLATAVSASLTAIGQVGSPQDRATARALAARHREGIVLEELRVGRRAGR